MISNVNIWAIIIADVVAIIIGAVWYSKVLFGKQWMDLVGINEDQAKSNCRKMIRPMLINLITNLILFFALGRILFLTTTTSVSGSVAMAILLWLGFIASTTISMVIWEKKSWNLYFINVGYSLVSFVAAGLIFASFN